MEDLDIKNHIYYKDMIADLKEIAGIESITDETQRNRIQERHRLIKKQ